MARVLLLLFLMASAHAQWVDHPYPGLPRDRAGKANLTAKAPRINGKPDLSGVWHVKPNSRDDFKKLFGPDFSFIEVPGMEIDTISKYGAWILADFPMDQPPMTESAAKIFARRFPEGPEVLPSTHCLPLQFPLVTFLSEFTKIVQTPTLTVVMLELNNSFRQIYTDGRKLQDNPSPSWLGYSVGRWEGDTFVVESNGFRNEGWLDVTGHPSSEALRITERYTRRDLGHMDAEFTFNDPLMYTRPFTIKVAYELQPDTDILEYVCLENEKDKPHMGLN